ncbi:MAG: hypothetical protein ACOCZ9_00280 [Spirochaetota bacterium]
MYFKRVGKRRNRLIQELISSLSTSFIFGALWAVSGSGIWLFIGLFAGVFPALGSAGKLLAEIGDQRRLAREAPKMARARQEKELLRVAKMESGSITPAVAALRTSCSIEEADGILQTLAARGYATMDFDENGRVFYSFPEFSPSPRSSDDTSATRQSDVQNDSRNQHAPQSRNDAQSGAHETHDDRRSGRDEGHNGAQSSGYSSAFEEDRARTKDASRSEPGLS